MGFLRQIRQFHSAISLRNERGASFVEAAMVVPLLVCVAFGTIEIGRALNQYATLVAIAEEGARLGSRIANLGTGTVTSSYNLSSGTSALVSCSQTGSNCPALNHNQIRDQVAELIKLQSDNLSVSNIQIVTAYRRNTNPNTIPRDSISVRILARYIGLFRATNYLTSVFGFDGLQIRTEAIGPYIDPVG